MVGSLSLSLCMCVVCTCVCCFLSSACRSSAEIRCGTRRSAAQLQSSSTRTLPTTVRLITVHPFSSHASSPLTVRRVSAGSYVPERSLGLQLYRRSWVSSLLFHSSEFSFLINCKQNGVDGLWYTPHFPQLCICLAVIVPPSTTLPMSLELFFFFFWSICGDACTYLAQAIRRHPDGLQSREALV
jgi:hypothetical protein